MQAEPITMQSVMQTASTLCGLIALNAVCVCSEFALISAPRATLDQQPAHLRFFARRVHDVITNPIKQDRYVATSQVGITIASLGLGMFGEHAIAQWLVHLAQLMHLELPPALVHSVSGIAAIGSLTYMHIVFGEMIPKALALKFSVYAAMAVILPMTLSLFVAYPIVRTLNAISNAVLSLFGMRRGTVSFEGYTVDEIQLLVKDSEAAGFLDPHTKDVVRELVDFSRLSAHDIMIPRTHIHALPLGAETQELRECVSASLHTRYPVYQETLDEIVGYIHVKDVLYLLNAREPLTDKYLHKVPFVPETTSLDGVFATIKQEGIQMVVIIDEFGGTSGILTLADLFSEVITADQVVDMPGADGQESRDRVLTGMTRVDTLNQMFGVHISHEHVSTVNGIIQEKLQRAAQVGDILEIDDLLFEVVSVEHHAVATCKVSLRDNLQEDETENLEP